jgi:predicted aldo/keto reductase-like oxidoreductase
VACGECRARCPFGVDTVERMKQAAEVFESHTRM